MYPFNDEYMIYDYDKHRYILTKDFVEEKLGINLSERSKNNVAILSLLDLVSIQVYKFIHEHNYDDEYQDMIIAKTKSGRKIIQEAMAQQFIYISVVGDLTKSTDLNKRKLWFDENAKSILERPLCEIGCSILYTGDLPNACLPKGAW